MDHANLRAVRAQWHEAFVAGDTQALQRLQGPDFIVVAATGVQTRAMQLQGIADAARSGQWLAAGSRAQDERLVLRSVRDDVVLAHGVSRIHTPQRDQPAVLFTELWVHTAGEGWRVQHLHYHPAPHKR